MTQEERKEMIVDGIYEDWKQLHGFDRVDMLIELYDDLLDAEKDQFLRLTGNQ